MAKDCKNAMKKTPANWIMVTNKSNDISCNFTAKYCYILPFWK